MRRPALLALFLTLLAILTPVRAADDGLTLDERYALRALEQATVTIEEASQKAFELEPNSIQTRIYLKMEEERPVWAVVTLTGEVFRTNLIDARTAERIRSEDRRDQGSAHMFRAYEEQGSVGILEAQRQARVLFEGTRTYDVRATTRNELMSFDVLLMKGQKPMLARLDASGALIESGQPPRPNPKKR